MPQLSHTQREEIEKLAYQLWKERGRPLGSPDEDWFVAEREFIQRSVGTSRLTFALLTAEPVEPLSENVVAQHD
jgi:hypothetical protein